MIDFDAYSCTNAYMHYCHLNIYPSTIPDRLPSVPTPEEPIQQDWELVQQGLFNIVKFTISFDTTTALGIDFRRSKMIQSIVLAQLRYVILDENGEEEQPQQPFDGVDIPPPAHLPPHRIKTATRLAYNITVDPAHLTTVDKNMLLPIIKRQLVGDADNVNDMSTLHVDVDHLVGYYLDEYRTADGDVKMVRFNVDTPMPRGTVLRTTEIMYHGDGRFEGDKDCLDPTTPTCTIALRIYTGDIYPDTIMGSVVTQELSQNTIANEYLGCDNIEGSDVNPRLRYAIMLSYNHTTAVLQFFGMNAPGFVTPGYFTEDTPLRKTKNVKGLGKNVDFYACTIKIQNRIQHARVPLGITPDMLLNTDYRTYPYNLYANPLYYAPVQRQFPSFAYYPLGYGVRESCYEPNTVEYVCALEVSFIGSKEVPFVSAYNEFDQHTLTTHPFFINAQVLVQDVWRPQVCNQPGATGRDFVVQENAGGTIFVSENTQYLVFEFPFYDVDVTDLNLHPTLFANKKKIGTVSILLPICDLSLPVNSRTVVVEESWQSVGRKVMYGEFNFRAMFLTGIAPPEVTDYERGLYMISPTRHPQFINLLTQDQIDHKVGVAPPVLPAVTPYQFPMPPIMVGRSLEVLYRHSVVTEAREELVTFELFEHHIDNITISTILGAFDIIPLPCYRVVSGTTYANNVVYDEEDVFAFLWTNVENKETYLIVNTNSTTNTTDAATGETYIDTAGVMCAVNLPINHIYNNQQTGTAVRHRTFKTPRGQQTVIFTRWSYPRYMHSAGVVQITGGSSGGYAAAARGRSSGDDANNIAVAASTTHAALLLAIALISTLQLLW